MGYIVDNGVLWKMGDDDYFCIEDKIWHADWPAVAARITELIQLMGAVEIDRRKMSNEEAMFVTAYLGDKYRHDSTPDFHVFQREGGQA